MSLADRHCSGVPGTIPTAPLHTSTPGKRLSPVIAVVWPSQEDPKAVHDFQDVGSLTPVEKLCQRSWRDIVLVRIKKFSSENDLIEGLGPETHWQTTPAEVRSSNPYGRRQLQQVVQALNVALGEQERRLFNNV